MIVAKAGKLAHHIYRDGLLWDSLSERDQHTILQKYPNYSGKDKVWFQSDTIEQGEVVLYHMVKLLDPTITEQEFWESINNVPPEQYQSDLAAYIYSLLGYYNIEKLSQ